MKNKKISLTLIIVSLISSGCSLINSNKNDQECRHNYVLLSDEPATCTEPSTTIHKCTECGELYVFHYQSALGHSFKEINTTATCTQNGIATLRCERCGEEKTAESYAKGHQFVNGICSVCGEWIYRFNLLDDLPKSVGYAKATSGYYTQCDILSLSFVEKSGSIYAEGTLKKTSDYKGEFGTTSVAFKIKYFHYDTDQVVGITEMYFTNAIAVGQTYKFSKKTDLNPSSIYGTYNVTLGDY